MTVITAALPRLGRPFARHPGRRACYGRTVHRGINAVALVAGLVITAGFLMATSQQLPRQQPRCVRWHSCACRFPGQGSRWPGHNQLCAINWEPAPRALPHGGVQQ